MTDPLTAHPENRKDRQWEGAGGAVSQTVLAQSERCLASYEANPGLIEEHANIERSTTQGGYGHRQLYELVQNGADELQDEPGGCIHVVLTSSTLYCANLGSPITPEGAETILASHLSRKRGTEIGRFGLGFKSVLSVSDAPQFFSRTGSFGWDAEKARAAIRNRVPGGRPTPVLRIAHLLDAELERSRDPILDTLAAWATTVVRLPLKPDEVPRLAGDIDTFPSEFALFSPHVGEVVLEDRRDPAGPFRRVIRVRGDGRRRELVVENPKGTHTSEWIVFDTIHEPTEEARRDAGEYHNRREVPLAWAVPTSGHTGLGAFWAFFPTTYATTLRGVLNAPWKTNEDRQNLLQNNRFNEELMEAAARLIVESLPELATDDDPARHLTLITARGREARNWADDMLTDLVYGMAARSPSVPDQSGSLRRPSDIKLHPPRLSPDWLTQWSTYPGRPAEWCHPTVEDTVRRSRVETIMERAGKGPVSVRAWLEALVADGTANASAVAVMIIAEIVGRQHDLAEQARRARVLRTVDGAMVAPIADTVFRGEPLKFLHESIRFVDPALENDPGASAALSTLGILEADAAGRFAAVVARGFTVYRDSDWDVFWQLARQTGVEQAVAQLEEKNVPTDRVKVRVKTGRYVPLNNALLPGRVVPSGSSSDHDVVVDTGFHSADLGLLRALGLDDGPRTDVDSHREQWFSSYREEMVERYYRSLPPTVRRPQGQSIVLDGPSPPGPLGLLKRLSHAARARFIAAIPQASLTTEWTVRAKTRQQDSPLPVPSPLLWMLRQEGYLPTSHGPRPVWGCVAPALAEHARVLPVAEVDSALSVMLELPDTLQKISGRLWSLLISDIESSEDDDSVGHLYGLAAAHLSSPAQIRCRRGTEWALEPPDDVAVTEEEKRYERLNHHGVPALLAPDREACGRLISSWGMRPFDDAVTTEIQCVPVDDATPLEDVFPYLRFLPGRPAQGLSVVHCEELDELIRTPKGQVCESRDIALQDDIVYWRATEDDGDLVHALNDLLGLGLSEDQINQVLRQREEARRSDQIVRVRNAKDPADKLLAMLPAAVLKERLPELVLDAVETAEGKLDDRSVAELALAVHGPGVLRKYREDLEARSILPPTQLAGGHEARRFVQDLGFPTEFAGFRRPSLEPVVTVDGPVDLPDLHDYQERMVQRMCEVLQTRDPHRRRGMLSLPTGAGKTRMAVEAVIRAATAHHDDFSGPVLWIAQTEELCEQAVQNWQFAWRHIGPPQRLTISRLWSTNEADPVEDGFHLVVTIDQKLNRVINSDDYAWLREADAVIVDEAHTSISPLYTRLFDTLGLTAHRTRCPLIGLSATPFRGSDKAETDRLVKRYGMNRLDLAADGAEILGPDPYGTLQDLGVLARVRHKELPGSTLKLSPDEQSELSRLHRLPSAAEARLGEDQNRNTVLVDEVCSLPADWPILLFATSVNQAQALAALLVRRGVPAAAVAGSTEHGERRHIIESFRRREIRVLTNYGVLSQGFDAPSTKVVIVARPTYSPNVYQQMIGRGLRGPLNGGNKECLIVNVADNIAQYGEELAFRRFEHLWRQR